MKRLTIWRQPVFSNESLEKETNSKNPTFCNISCLKVIFILQLGELAGSVAFINGKQERQWVQPVSREELPELSAFMTRADTVCTLWGFALLSRVLPLVKSDYHWNRIEVQRFSTTKAEQYLGVMPSSKTLCCRKYFHTTLKGSLFP